MNEGQEAKIEFLDDNNNKRILKPVNKFKLIEGGGGSSNINWLEGLPEDSVFICEMKGTAAQAPNFMCLTLTVGHKTPRTTVLMDNFTDTIFGRVDNVRFCGAMQLIEVLYDPRNDTKQEEGGDNDPPNVI